MSTLPPDWEWVTVADIADVQLGRQRSPQHHSGPNMRPYLRSANVTWAGLALDDVKSMNFERRDAEAFKLHPGDILLTEGSGSPGEVGKPAIWRGEIPECCFQNTLLRVRSRGPRVEYLYWYFYFAAAQGRFGAAGRGANIRHLGKRGLVDFQVPLAPLAEQDRIVSLIEEHLSRLDAAETSLASIEQMLARFKNELLRQAFDSRWAEVPLSTVTDPDRVIRYGIVQPGKDTPHGVPVVKVRDYPRGEILSEQLMKARPEIAAKFAGASLKGGDILLSIRGTYGRVAVVPESLDGANITQDSARIAAIPAIDRDFLVHYLRSPAFQDRLQNVARGVAVKGVNIRDLRTLNVPIPELATQLQVAQTLDVQLSIHAHLAAEIRLASAAIASLRRLILATAFEGRLDAMEIAEDPTVGDRGSAHPITPGSSIGNRKTSVS